MSKGVLFDPDAFFSQCVDGGSILRVLGVVLSCSVVGVVGSLGLAVRLAAALPDSVEAVAIFGAVVTAAVSLLEPLALWLGFGTVIHVSSTWLSDESVQLRTTIRLVGWGFLPYLIGIIAVNFAAVYVAWTTPLPSSFEGLSGFGRSISTNQLVTAVGGLRVVLVLWSGVLWSYAVKHLRGVSFKDAVLSTFAPTLGLLVIVAWSVGLLPP